MRRAPMVTVIITAALTALLSAALPSAASSPATASAWSPSDSCAVSTTWSIKTDPEHPFSESEVAELRDDLRISDDPCVSLQLTPDGQPLPPLRTASQNPFQPHQFTSGAPSFMRTDNQGTFSAQVTYIMGRWPVAFSWRLDPELAAATIISPVATSGRRTPGNCTYNKASAPWDYLFHWSCPSHVASQNYNWTHQQTFKVHMAGGPATATVTVNFNYIIRSI